MIGPRKNGRPEHPCNHQGNLSAAYPLEQVKSWLLVQQIGIMLKTIEIYDPEIDIWYYSKDLPSNPSNSSGRLSVWNDNPIFIDRENIWKFEDGKWTLLESKPTNELSSYNLGFTIIVPDDFIPDC